MNAEEIFEKLSFTVKNEEERFKELGINTKIEYAYLNGWMQNVDSIEKSKYVTISLILYTDRINEGDEYCLSLGAEIKKSSVNDEILERDSKQFKQLTDEAYERLSAAESKTDEISAMAKEASEEFDKLVEDVKKAEKKKRITSLVGIIIIIGIFAFLILLKLWV